MDPTLNLNLFPKDDAKDSDQSQHRCPVTRRHTSSGVWHESLNPASLDASFPVRDWTLTGLNVKWMWQLSSLAVLWILQLVIGEGASYTSVYPSHRQECLNSVGTLWVLSKSISLITVCRSSHLLFMAVEAEGKGSAIRGQMYCQHRACFYMGWISKMKQEAKLFNVSCQESAWISAAQRRGVCDARRNASLRAHMQTRWSGVEMQSDVVQLLQVGYPERHADISHRGYRVIPEDEILQVRNTNEQMEVWNVSNCFGHWICWTR